MIANSKPNWLSIVAVVIAMMSIQSGAAFAKGLFPIVGSLGTSALRLGFSAVILCLIWKTWKNKFKSSDLKLVIPYGFSLGAMNLFFYLAIERVPLGIAVALEFSGPLAIALLSSKNLLHFVWAILAVLGVFLLMPILPTSAGLDPIGVAYALLAGFFWALYIIFGQKAGKLGSAGVVASLGILVAALFVTPIGVVSAGKSILSLSIIPLALLVAVLSSSIPYSLEMLALKNVSARNFGILMSLEPALGALFGFILLSEKLSWVQVSAIFCIVFASLGSSYSSSRQAKSLSPDL